uniref:Regulator of microtubule dynamics protein 1 n=1 Tax=Panagrolaimus superbus TaxID=310955 RepID=A0A914Z819_9BILA
MFRRAFSVGAKLATGIASVQMGAAAVALTDKQLGKKPEYYKNAVLSLESALKHLSTYQFIESEEKLNEAQTILTKVADIENAEILWRLARVLAEKADLTKSADEKKKLLKEAAGYAKKALAIEPSSGCAGAHKWYAIIICQLLHVDTKVPKNKIADLKADIKKHLHRATEIDPKDPFAWYLLGRHYFENKDYKEAINHFEKAEGLKSKFSSANLYYLGECQRHLGKKPDAIETLKAAYLLQSKNKHDGKAKSEAKRILLSTLKQKVEDIEAKSEW